MLSCKECDKVYLGETGHQFLQRFWEYKRGEDNRNTNSLYMRHFIDEGNKFVNPIENNSIIYKIIKIINNINKIKFGEEVKILKIRNINKKSLMNIMLTEYKV